MSKKPRGGELIGTGAKFSEVLRAKIEDEKGVFEVSHPFFRTALEGLARRLDSKPSIRPMDYALVTGSYFYDLSSGIDGFTGEPMPADVVGASPALYELACLVADDIAFEAFGRKFGKEVRKIERKIAASSNNQAE